MNELGVDQLYVKRFAIVVFKNWLATNFSKLILGMLIYCITYYFSFVQCTFCLIFIFVKTAFHRYSSFFLFI